MRARLAFALILACGPAAAHPHIFIDAGIEAILDGEGRLDALRITWDYDDFYSLLILEDRGLDPDGDGTLTADEAKALDGFDMTWDADFPGDTYALKDGAPVVLSRPENWTTALTDGRIVTTHLRHVEPPVALPVTLKVYDPTYYTAYDVTLGARVTGGTGCTARVVPPDPRKGDRTLKAALAKIPVGMTAEAAGFPAIGAAFAEEVRLSCKG